MTLFPFLCRYVCIRNVLRSERHPVAVLCCALNLTCAVIGWVRCTPQKCPEQLLRQANHENTPEGGALQTVTTTHIWRP